MGGSLVESGECGMFVGIRSPRINTYTPRPYWDYVI